jgi:gliding motility-associated-like protein
MAVIFSNYNKKLAISLLVILSIGLSEAFCQKELSGNFNQFKARVLTKGADRITVDDYSGFAVGDTVLLIQMQGIGIGIPTTSVDYGLIGPIYGAPGLHEFIIIKELNSGNEIVFEKNIKNPYDVNSSVQVIKVPYYNSAKVTEKLFTDPWDPVAKKGGVLALIIGRSLELKADIDLSGIGFRGGRDTIGLGRCQDVPPLTDLFAYSAAYTNAGYKGESPSIHNEYGGLLWPANVKGIGANFTGGGGGNGKFSGGGGGSNRGKGGLGGWDVCGNSAEARGGWAINHPGIINNLFFGGGGGASTSLTGLSTTGGNGGGIVIIVADAIFSSGGKIIVNGQDGYAAIANGGAGGGGGGGTIALQLNNYGSDTLVLSAAGGKGGNSLAGQNYGEGGGGGGGFIYVKTGISVNVNPVISGGSRGINPAAYSEDGAPGVLQTGFQAVLNGFLYNSIRSTISGNQVDSVCSDKVPPAIKGTIPIGGNTPYTYSWEKSYDNFTTLPITLPDVSMNFIPSAPDTATVWYRRIVVSSAPDALSDTSMPVKIIVQPFIKNNTIGSDAIICYDQNPDILTTGVLADGNGKYAFKWEVSTDNSTYSPAENTNNTQTYAPPSLTVDSWFKRTVTSGSCISTSLPVAIDVLDSISNNKILTPDDSEICNGMIFNDLKGDTVLAGGDGTFRYKWERNINRAGWTVAPGINDTADYNPLEINDTIPNEYYFRRVVMSGPGNVCTSVSDSVLLKDYPKITGNTISISDTTITTICSGSAPDTINGLVPKRGNGIYTYTWQKSTKTQPVWTDISGATARDYLPGDLTDTTSYRRIVHSSDCSDISNSITINVHKPISNNFISLLSPSDTVICYGLSTNKLLGTVPTGGTDIAGTYSFKWLFSTDNNSFNPVSVSDTLKDFKPPVLYDTTYYKRMVTSGRCADTSSVLKIYVLPAITNTISSSQTICLNTRPKILTGNPSGGNGIYTYTWQDSTNINSWTDIPGAVNLSSPDYPPVALTTPVKYRRIVTSGPGGCSTSVSNTIDISIYPPLPTAAITDTLDKKICGGSDIQLQLKLTGSGPWKVTYNENATNAPEMLIYASNTTLAIKPASIDTLNTYNYSITKVEDNNGCLAVTMTGAKKAYVYKFPIANAGEDKIICGPTVTLTASPSVGTGVWTYPGHVVDVSTTGPTTTFTMDSTIFVNGVMNHSFIWTETNWTCISKDSADVTLYRRVSNINAGRDTTLNSFDKIFYLQNDLPEAWETGVWETIRGSGSVLGDRITGLSKNDTNSFSLRIYNTIETCSLTDILNIFVLDIDVPEGFSPNNDPEGYNNTFEIKGLDLEHQNAELSIVNSAGKEVFTTSNSNWRNWDGTNSAGSDLPEGTYYYLLKLISTNADGSSNVYKKSGFVILKRY